MSVELAAKWDEFEPKKKVGCAANFNPTIDFRGPYRPTHVVDCAYTGPGTSWSSNMDWKLGLFRIGLFACVVWAVVVATQFDVVGSAVAVWNRNPTSHAAQRSVTDAAKRQTACLTSQAHAPSAEYPSSCYSNDPTFRGMPRDQAIANLRDFLITISPLPFLLFGVVSLGLRMARESRAE